MIEQDIELANLNKTLHFEFNHENVKKFSTMGGRPTDLLADPIGSIELLIRSCLMNEGTVSNSKAEKLYDALAEEYEILDVLGVLAEKYNEVFIGGENASPKKKLSDMK